MHILALFVLSLLAACAGARPVSPPGMLAYEVSLAAQGDAIAVAWHGGAAGRDSIWLQALDANGAPLRLTDGARDAYEPDLQWVAGEALVAWYEKDAAGATRAWLARFDAAGNARWRVALSAPDRRSRNPVVRVGADGVHVAWLESGGSVPARVVVRVARYDSEGHARGASIEAGAAGTDTWNLNAALATDGTFLVAYDARSASRAKELQLLRITDAGVQATPLGNDDGFDSTYPDIALEAGRIAMAWTDVRDGNEEVYLAVGTLAELTSNLAARARRVTRTPGASIGAYLAWNGPRLLVTWCDDSAGRYEIYRQEFDAQGVALTPIVQVTHTRTDSSIPAVRPAGTGFVLAWTEREALPAAGTAGRGVTTRSRVLIERVH